MAGEASPRRRRITPVVRRATVADAPAIGAISVRSWGETYAGLMPQGLLDAMDVGRRTVSIERAIAGAQPRTAILVVEADGLSVAEGSVLGYSAIGRRARETRTASRPATTSRSSS